MLPPQSPAQGSEDVSPVLPDIISQICTSKLNYSTIDVIISELACTSTSSSVAKVPHEEHFQVGIELVGELSDEVFKISEVALICFVTVWVSLGWIGRSSGDWLVERSLAVARWKFEASVGG